MITFKTLLETVYEPKSGDEKNFKDKHIVAKYKTPYDTESQFTSTATKAKRKADYNAKEDEQVYEAAVLHTKRADKEAVIVRAVDPNTGQSKARVVKRGTGEIKIGEALDPVGKHDADIDNDGDVDKSDKYLIARRKAIGKAIRKEEIELDELSKKTLGSYAKKASKDAAGKALKYGYNNAGDNPLFMKAAKRLSGVDKAVDKMTKEEVEQIDEISPNTLHSYIKKAAPDVVSRTMSAVASNQSAETKKHASKLGNRIKGITAASGRLADKANAVSEESEQIDEISRDLARSYIRKVADKNNTGEASPKEVMKRSPGVALAGKKVYGIGGKAKVVATESVELDEAFKIGAMKLKDGSTVTLTRESVDAFNKLFNQLNSANKAKMEERMLSGKAGFQEILGFAENI